MNKGYFINQLRKHENKSSNAMIYFDGRVCTYEDILDCFERYKIFCEKEGIELDCRIGLCLEDSFHNFKLGLSILESMTCVLLEKEHKSSIPNEIELFHIDYILVDRLDDLSEEIKQGSCGIIVYHDSKFEMIKKTTCIKTINHSKDLAYISKTSGTNSIPKLVPIEYDTLVFKQNMNVNHFKMDKDTIQIQTVKMNRFISISNALRVISQHGLVLQTDGIKTKEIIQYLKEYSVRFIVCVPAGIQVLLDHMDESIDLSNCSLIVGGSYLDDSLAQRLKDKHATVISYYGMTETGSIASSYHAPKGFKEGSVGWAKIECKIIDQEICVRGPAVFKGYENVSNEEVFVDGWFKTGDLGWKDEDGYLYITGRKSEIINRKGEKVSPYEIEKLLSTHPFIKECIVFPYVYDKNEEVGCAVVLHEGKKLNLNEIRRFLSKDIKPFKMPSELYLVDEIPLSENDKVQRKTLHKTLIELKIPKHVYDHESEDLSRIEAHIKHYFIKVLHHRNIHKSDDFFESGGDSLRVNELISLVEKYYSIDLSIEDFLKNRSIEKLSAFIINRPQSKSKIWVNLNTIQSDLTVVCLHSGDGAAINYQHLAQGLNLRCVAFDCKTKVLNELNVHSMEELIQVYVQEIKKHVHGEIILVGDCLGGIFAFECAHQCLNQNMPIKYVILLDTPQIKTHRKKSSFIERFIMKTKRNLLKLKGLSVSEKIRHLSISLRKMGSFIQYRYQIKHYDTQSKAINHRVRLNYFVSKYAPPYYANEIHYIKSIDTHNKTEHIEFWKNHSQSMKIDQFTCKHDEFLNQKHVSELINYIHNLVHRVV